MRASGKAKETKLHFRSRKQDTSPRTGESVTAAAAVNRSKKIFSLAL
jgi:hypothetical protein